MRSTIVLLHGAFAESASWARVIEVLPVTQEALAEPSSGRPLWRDMPSWFVFGDDDRNIPATLQRLMAERAGARRAVNVPGASHAIAVSHPDLIAQVVFQLGGVRAVA